MKVGIAYYVLNMECSACKKKWTAAVEIDKVEWFDGSVEYGYPHELECPDCGLFTEVNTDNAGPNS